MLSRCTKGDRFILARAKPLMGIVILAVSMLDASLVRAQSEDEIKAAFLLNFARYVEWPSSAFESKQSPLRICVLASDGFDSVVASTVEGKTVGSRGVEVLTVEAASASSGCHILFVGSASVEEVLASLRQSSVFTVANDEGFAKDGGVANFIRANNRVRFEINPNAAKNAGLKISSRLLRLAQLVE